MCSGSYERNREPFNLELYRPSLEVRRALGETVGGLMHSPNHTMPIGRKLFGVQHYATVGWFHDEEHNKVVELKAHWLERGHIANFFLNPTRPRVSIKAVSVAHIEPQPGPYRLFSFNVPCDRIDTCEYDDYEADANAALDLGSLESMREQFELAQQNGEDFLTSETENQLIDSLHTGNEIGWQPIPGL